MKIIIVEDEPRTREGLVRIIESHTSHQVSAAVGRAETGLALILEDPPDLVITDIKMGDMDGLAMLDRIRGAGIGSAFIILTGYSSFEYARRAIHLNVIDYLLKPVMVEELLGSLDKVKKPEKDPAMESLGLERLFERHLTSENAGMGELAGLLRTRYEVDISAQHIMVLFQLKSVDSESFSWAVRQIKEGSSMLCMENAVVVELFSQQSVVLLLMQAGRNPLLERNLERYVLPGVGREVRCLCMAHRFSGLDGLRQGMGVCRAMQPYALLIPENLLITEERIRKLPNLKLEYPAGLERRMKRAIFRQDGGAIHEISAQFQEILFSGQYSPESMAETMARFLCTICVTAEEKEAALKGAFNYSQLVHDIGTLTSAAELSAYFENIVGRILCNGREDRCAVNNQIISKVIGYIQGNYMNEVSLTALAANMGVTPEYLSNLFRKEMGINFSSFLKNFRISHAKRLLEKQQIKIHDVALRVGFNDPKYFNRVFKEVCGFSPTEYRSYRKDSAADTEGRP